MSPYVPVILTERDGINEIRRYIGLLINSKIAYFTLTNGPKSGQTISIPLEGIREALQSATCSAVNIASYLPGR